MNKKIREELKNLRCHHNKTRCKEGCVFIDECDEEVNNALTAVQTEIDRCLTKMGEVKHGKGNHDREKVFWKAWNKRK